VRSTSGPAGLLLPAPKGLGFSMTSPAVRRGRPHPAPRIIPAVPRAFERKLEDQSLQTQGGGKGGGKWETPVTPDTKVVSTPSDQEGRSAPEGSCDNDGAQDLQIEISGVLPQEHERPELPEGDIEGKFNTPLFCEGSLSATL